MNFITIVTIKLRYAHAFLIDWKIPYKHYLSREIGYTIIYAIFCKKKKKWQKSTAGIFCINYQQLKFKLYAHLWCTGIFNWSVN